MKYFWIILFLVILLLELTYAMYRTWVILPSTVTVKRCVMICMALCMLLFFLNFFVSDKLPWPAAVTMYEAGNSTLFILLYLVILYAVLDLCRLVGIVPDSFMQSSMRGTVFVAVVMVCVFTYGYFNYMHKQRVELNVTTDKPLARPLKIVIVSDLHLGYHNRIDEFDRWIKLINAEKPDMVLIGGDIIDGSIRAVRHQPFAQAFHKIKAPVYACLGNHEYISGIREARKFYADAGIHLLVDSSATACGITVTGRDDRSNLMRRSVSVLTGLTEKKGLYTILLDHQPYNLDHSEGLVDFQFSGHTHYGQMWPISWIEDAIYEDAFGPLKKSNTDYYVSSGLGIWGAKFRVGTRSEYVVLTVKPKEAAR